MNTNRYYLLFASISLCLPISAIENSIKRIPFETQSEASSAVVVTAAPLVHTGQILPIPPGAQSSERQLVVDRDPKVQVRVVFAHLRKALELAKSDPSLVVKLNVYVADSAVTDFVRKEIGETFTSDPPAVSYVTTALPLPDAKVAIDAVSVSKVSDAKGIVVVGAGGDVGSRSGPAATIMPIGSRVYISGQAEKGDGSLADATRQTLGSLLQSLQFLKLDRSHVVQLKAFLTPMADVASVEREVRDFFAGHSVPPLICVAWKSSLPIEIELIASNPHVPVGDPGAVEYLAPPALQHSPVFSRIARVSHPTTIYVSGLVAGAENKPAEQEVRDLLTELSSVVKKAGSDMRHLVKATYYVTDDDSSNGLNKLRPEFYDPARPPSASKAVVQGVGFFGHRLTLDMIAIPKE